MIPAPRFDPPNERREPRLPAERSAERPPPSRRDNGRRSAGGSFRRPGLVAAPRADAGSAACACALLTALHCVGAAAQQPPAPGSYVLELTMRDRWVHEGQHPGFVAFEETRTPMRLGLEFSAFDDRGRYLELRVGNRETRLSLDSTNRTGSIHIDEPPLDISRYEDAREQVEHRRWRLDGPGALLALPPARFWEVPFVVPSEPLRAGVTWSDTLSFVAAAEGMSERLEGVWRSRVVGDTLMHGRSLPIVETTAELRYRAHELTPDPSMDTVFVVMRDVAGTMRGRAAVDTLTGVRAAGADTTLLTGTAELRMGDGPPLVSGVRYDRQRSWALLDSAVWAAREDSIREQRRRQHTGMLILPHTPLEERLRDGDAAAADSLFDVWRTTDDPNERIAIQSLLRWTNASGSSGVSAEARLLELKRAAGDTAGIIHAALGAVGRRPGLSLDVLPYLDDPARLWRLGFMPRYTYVTLAEYLLRASPIVQPDTTRWDCRPDVCAAVIAMAETAREPRLRDAALAGAFARDPAHWYDRVVARADSGSAIARLAARLGAGVGATWPAAPQTPMPEPGADWRTWLEWMGGTVRWGSSHFDALRIYTARTGRDPVQELVRAWPPAGDSARLVIGTILRGADALADRSAGDLAAALLSGSEVDRRAARAELADIVQRLGRPAPDSLVSSLLRPFLDALSSGAAMPWPYLDGRRTDIHAYMSGFHGVTRVPVFVLDENLPSDIGDAVLAPFSRIARQQWEARPLREGGVLVTFAPTIVWEDFVRMTLDWRAYERRAPNEAPSGYAGGGSFTLLRTPDGWRIAAVAMWIT